MTRFVRPLLPALLGAMLLLSACAEGPVGPPGPPGNANVFSLTFLFTMDDASISGPVASVGYEVPAITPSVVDDGAVLLYFREQGTWTAMPYTFADESPDLPAVDYTITLGYGYDDRFLEVFYEASTADIPLENQPDREIKAVIIDGFPAAKAAVDFSDYEAVRAYFNLTD
ncbi:hypothetical protein AWN76_001990 [Rhodothermaceae bacterium RA]|nr:hypothetical protein AWN76_001990 [Rhodothermaceae bacterium RA]